jgi:hypothetical protein
VELPNNPSKKVEKQAFLGSASLVVKSQNILKSRAKVVVFGI